MTNQSPASSAGSIPARAGEPRRVLAEALATRVYPRPCGGASELSRSPLIDRGLSPPVRGSLPT